MEDDMDTLRALEQALHETREVMDDVKARVSALRAERDALRTLTGGTNVADALEALKVRGLTFEDCLRSFAPAHANGYTVLNGWLYEEPAP